MGGGADNQMPVEGYRDPQRRQQLGMDVSRCAVYVPPARGLKLSRSALHIAPTGGRRDRTLYADPPPPPCRVLAGKCGTMGAKGALRKFCLT